MKKLEDYYVDVYNMKFVDDCVASPQKKKNYSILRVSSCYTIHNTH